LTNFGTKSWPSWVNFLRLDCKVCPANPVSGSPGHPDSWFGRTRVARTGGSAGPKLGQLSTRIWVWNSIQAGTKLGPRLSGPAGHPDPTFVNFRGLRSPVTPPNSNQLWVQTCHRTPRSGSEKLTFWTQKSRVLERKVDPKVDKKIAFSGDENRGPLREKVGQLFTCLEFLWPSSCFLSHHLTTLNPTSGSSLGQLSGPECQLSSIQAGTNSHLGPRDRPPGLGQLLDPNLVEISIQAGTKLGPQLRGRPTRLGQLFDPDREVSTSGSRLTPAARPRVSGARSPLAPGACSRHPRGPTPASARREAPRELGLGLVRSGASGERSSPLERRHSSGRQMNNPLARMSSASHSLGAAAERTAARTDAGELECEERPDVRTLERRPQHTRAPATG